MEARVRLKRPPEYSKARDCLRLVYLNFTLPRWRIDCTLRAWSNLFNTNFPNPNKILLFRACSEDFSRQTKYAIQLSMFLSLDPFLRHIPCDQSHARPQATHFSNHSFAGRAWYVAHWHAAGQKVPREGTTTQKKDSKKKGAEKRSFFLF